jgi:signal transduction histidine kinase
LSPRITEEVTDAAAVERVDDVISKPFDVQSLLTAVDPRLVRLVLTNLVANAIKFTEWGRIDVSVGKKNDTVCFAVRDTGPGTPPEDRARIFKPFEQLERLESKHLQGFGLGLALVKEMVAVLNGEIELFSQVGEGSTFVVSLPFAGEVRAP